MMFSYIYTVATKVLLKAQRMDQKYSDIFKKIAEERNVMFVSQTHL